MSERVITTEAHGELIRAESAYRQRLIKAATQCAAVDSRGVKQVTALDVQTAVKTIESKDAQLAAH